SARQFIADTAIADHYFAYTFTRHPIPGNPFVYIVPSDTNGTLEGINVNDSAEVASRLYVNTITKIGPDPLEIVLDRTVILRPFNTGIPENKRQVQALKIYPNPFTDKTILKFSIPDWSDIRIEIYNNLGQQVGNSLLINHVRGTVVHELRVSGQIPPGQYYIRGQVIPLRNSSGYSLFSSVILL
ncbi:MAG: T9SS type A sorting domain-containing protein, partial [Bacteroidales bacterium]|nr:T9SS type A sorting domain-containing protein [Bacteroidales bacterium]